MSKLSEGLAVYRANELPVMIKIKVLKELRQAMRNEYASQVFDEAFDCLIDILKSDSGIK